jgi:glutamyl-tRNA reductase
MTGATARGELVLVGASHHSAPIWMRERLALSPAQAGEILEELVGSGGAPEALVLSTCGRTELYAVAAAPDELEAGLVERLASHGGRERAELAPALRTARGRSAVEHLHRVAAGLESMALGEAEILGQLRRAGQLAADARASGPILARMLASGLATGRRVRHETNLGLGRTALASAVVGIASRHLGRRPQGTALVIGSGDTGAKTARALRAAGLVVKLVAGRRQERARRVAAELGCDVASRDDLPRMLVDADLVVSCTSAPHQLVSTQLLAGALQSRRGRGLIAIDLAVPRDFDPAARALDGVRLYDLDELERELRATAGRRIAAVPAAEAIVAGEVDRFMRWAGTLSVVPTIKDLRAHSEGAVFEALRRSRLAADADEGLLRAACEAVVTRLLHSPTLHLREAAAQGDAERLTHVVRELFALDAPLRQVLSRGT